MAGSKKRRRRSPNAATRPPVQPSRSGASPDRRDRKEQARKAREAARKRARRSEALRRVFWITAVALAVLLVVRYFQRASAVRPLPQAAVQAAKAAGCTGIQTPDPGTPPRAHLSPGASYAYGQHPATSGPHDPSPMSIPPHVYPSPIPETRAVHNLEHGAVILYYRQSGAGALGPAIVKRLTTIANESNNTILAPFPDLPNGESFALAAWNKLQTCPAGITGPQARAIARGFISSLACTRNAPESINGQGC
jgi:hypothetical protein